MVERNSKRSDRLCEMNSFMLSCCGFDGNQVDESQSTGKVSLGLSVIVRVTLRDGTFHEVLILG